jgi:hypothetical protein
MLTSGDIEFEPNNHTKIFGLSPAKAVYLGAGDTSVNFAVFTATHKEVIAANVGNVAEISGLCARECTSFRRLRAERSHLAPFGLDMESFVSRQAELVPELALDIAQRVRSETLDVETIVAGMDSDGPHIYSIGEFNDLGEEVFYETCHDGSGFWAVGSGARQFETLFMSSGYDTTWRLPDALLLMYSAKKRAEVSPGVGHLTDIFVITENSSELLPLRSMEAIEGYYKDLEAELKKKRDETVVKIAADDKIFRMI